jgi:gp16 family phage-associated protein
MALNANQAREWFRDNGITITRWAYDHGFSPSLVYQVAQGKRKCLRGQSHLIAVALGLKRLS